MKRCDENTADATRAKALNGLGTLLYWQGDYAGSTALLELSLTLSDSGDSAAVPAKAAFSLFLLAMIAVNGFAGDPWSSARPHLPLGFVSIGEGDPSTVRAHIGAYLRIMRGQGDLWETIPGLTSLGVFQRFVGERESAEATFRERIAVAFDLRNAMGWRSACGAWSQYHARNSRARGSVP